MGQWNSSDIGTLSLPKAVKRGGADQGWILGGILRTTGGMKCRTIIISVGTANGGDPSSHPCGN